MVPPPAHSKGHSGAHRGVASWNAPGYTTDGKEPARRYERKYSVVKAGQPLERAPNSLAAARPLQGPRAAPGDDNALRG